MIAATLTAPLIALPADRSRWLAGLTYTDATRAHTFEGRPIASVTQTLEQAGKTDFSMVKTQILQRKGLIGTAAHQAAHYYDEGDLATGSVDRAVAPYFDGWIAFREERDFTPLRLETVIFSRRHGYTGRLDRIGTVHGFDRLVLVDIKTGDPDAARGDLQTFAYEMAVEEELAAAGIAHPPLERWAVQVFANGRYRLTRYPKAPRSWRHDRAEFLEALSQARARTGLTWRPVMQSASESLPLPVDLPLDLPPDEPPPLDDLADVLTNTAPPEEPPAEDAPEEPTIAELAGFVEPKAASDFAVEALDQEQQQAALMERKRDQVVAEAGRLATSIVDRDTCEAAVVFATFVDDALREAHAYFDPLVERARMPYQDRLAERKAVVEPLEAAKALLVGNTGAVTRWLNEQKRLAEAKAREDQRIADEAAAAERKRLTDEAAARQREAEQATKAGDTERAQELARDAAAATHQAEQTVAAPVPVAAPAVSGVTGKKNWTAEVTNPVDLILAIARPTILKEAIAAIKGIEGWQQASPENIVAVLDFLEGQAPDVPCGAVEPNMAYLRTRAKADEGTLKWAGVRFYNAGSSSLAPANRRARS